MPLINEGGRRQKAHYETIHDEYEAHYYDAWSMAYRERFFFGPLLKGLDLNGQRLLDVASGSGFNTLLMRRHFPGLDAVGVDISDAACTAYTKTTGFPAVQADLTAPVLWNQSFDVALVIGGLHHCVSNLPQTLANLAAALRPGGVLLMAEPSADCWLESIRKLWYRQDRYFDAPTEHALSHRALLAQAEEWFTADDVWFIGGPAYFAILNSLVLRVPLAAKPLIGRLTFPLESLFNALNSRAAAPVFVAKWTRLPLPASLRT
jgi:SAM-dependent methyltransferase